MSSSPSFFFTAAISCYECGSMYDGTNFMGIKGYDQCQFFESDVILGASGEGIYFSR